MKSKVYEKKQWIGTIGLLLLGLLLISCTEPGSTGNLSIGFSEAGSKSILPSGVDVSWVQISGSRNGDGSVTFPAQNFQLGTKISITGLSVGTWTFNVVGYGENPTDTGAVALTKTASNSNVVIESGKTTSATFVLQYLSEGTGSADVTVTWPGDKVLVKGTLSKSDTTKEASSALSTSGSVLLSFSGVPTGDYGLEVTLVNPSGTTIAFPLIDMVNVFTGLTSKGTVALERADLPVIASPTMKAGVEATKGNPIYAYRTVSLSAASGTTIYYTTNGNVPGFTTNTSGTIVPDASTTKYTDEFDILTGTTTVKAIATKTGYIDSSVVSQSYTVNGTGSGSTEVTPPALVSDVVITQNKTDASKFTVSYATTGTPKETVTWYLDNEDTAATDADGDGNAKTFTPTGSIFAGRHQIMVSIAYTDSGKSRTAFASLRFTATSVATPSIVVSDVAGGKSVTITSATAGAVIYYTMDGSDPASSGTRAVYASQFMPASTNTVKAIAVKNGLVDSAVTSRGVTVSQVEAPVIGPGSCTFNGSLSVTINCGTGATIYYTTDGTTPTLSSATYTGAFLLTSTTTVKAIAVKNGMANSKVAGATYTLKTVYAVGDVGPAGGVVFYDKGSYSDSWRYLEAAPADEGMYVWGGYETAVGSKGTAIGTGKVNTKEIVAQFGATEPYQGKEYAAKACADKTMMNNETGYGYHDWFLPSWDELYEMYTQRNMINGFKTGGYWSSSEASSSSGWYVLFSDGSKTHRDKNSGCYVRAIRAF